MAQPAVAYTDDNLVGASITLNNCDREPIHIPGLIQPYGFMLGLDERTLRVVQASANTETMLGMTAESLLGAELDVLLGPDKLAEVNAIWPTLTEMARLVGARLDGVAGRPLYKLVLHRHDHLLWVEGEAVADFSVSSFDLPVLNLTLGRLLTAGTTLEMGQVAVEQVRELTGYDRVALYRFAEDGSGYVMAETVRADLPPWLGMHYPATDIPQQARAMYLKNWLRFIANADYVPVPLVPALNPSTGRPPDMTYAVLRSVSPIHLEYLRNMGTEASMVISLIRDGELWGMIACHHQTPRLVSYELRDLCQFLAKAMSALLNTKEQHDELEYRQRIRRVQGQLFTQLNAQQNFIEGLYRQPTTLLDVIDCGGVAICLEDETICLGQTPTKHQIGSLVAWLRNQPRQEIFATSSYATHNPVGLSMRATASGVLAAALSPELGEYLLWFRPEQVQTVTWAGRHEKNQTTIDGQVFLSPRQSFEAWKQTVEHTARPWRPLEIEAVQEIRRYVTEARLRIFNELRAKAAGLARLNLELERSNDELDSFAYVASHDLKEPLRGIHNYSVFLLEDYADRLDTDGVSKLQTLVRLSQRMEALIESLLQLSRVGRMELTVELTDPTEVVAGVVEMLQPRIEQTNSTVTVAGPLPTIRADRVRLSEVFNNLLTNAMRYNEQADKQVVIGLAPANVRSPRGAGDPADYHVFFVRDNGIGIAPRHHENIFKIFKRLHAQDKYGGGAGAGLAIAKKMVEKHEGELWVDSVHGQGATFYFSISKHL